MTTAGAKPQKPVSLAELRKRLGRSQAAVATAIGTTQSGVSRIERQSDIHVSTLSQYVAALGARLRLVVEHEGGQAEIDVPSLRDQGPSAMRREFRVIWQDRDTRALVHVGWLEFTGEEFVFTYTEEANGHPRFEPFPAFPQLNEAYRSRELFPFFSVRLINAADPQYHAVLDALGLTRNDATPAELLARAPSQSPHDTIQVVPEPTELPDGTLVRMFLVSGVRHADPQDPEQVGRVVGTLVEGQQLQLIPEPENPKNPRALQLAVDGQPIGWVPDYLVEETNGYLQSNRSLSVSVARANGPDVPWHLRLLCRLSVESLQDSNSDT
jgi:transcriptional regulator with XRE-family HTH domain